MCKPDTAARIASYPPPLKAYNQALLSRCRFHNIQRAVDAAGNGDRILILPGLYKEYEERKFPSNDPRCASLRVHVPGGTTHGAFDAPTYRYHLTCPHDQNIVAILGDTNDDYLCDAKCDLQIEGTGRTPADVTIDGDFAKFNVIRADRTDGIYFRNFRVTNGDFNALYIMETDGFVIDRVWGDQNVEYGFLTFASDHRLYDHCEASRNGDSGVYPGGAPDLHGARYGSRSGSATRTTTCSGTREPPGTPSGPTTTGSITTR